jgi:hypothetical protein
MGTEGIKTEKRRKISQQLGIVGQQTENRRKISQQFGTLGALKLKRDAKSTLRPTHTKHP